MNMAKEFWDFECPQYVDFERELDSSAKDDIFFESKDKSSERIRNLCTPEIQGKGKGLTESDENRLLGKMTAALSVLENTPKVKKNTTRGKLFSEDYSKVTDAKIIKSTIKPKTDSVSRPKLRRSRSLDHLNKIISGKTSKKKECALRKSSSLNDVRNHNKLKYPITPMCLKRTIIRAKEKIKTTEEMELEQIARLQKQLIQHLRQNEISLRKLNLRPRQCVASKALPKAENLKDPKGGDMLIEKSNADEKESRKNTRLLCRAPIKKKPSERDTIINKENVLDEKTRNTIYSRKSKAFSASAVDLDVNNHILNQAVMREKASKLYAVLNNQSASNRKTIYSQKLKVRTTGLDVNKPATQKTKKLARNRIVDHSGIIFVPSVKSNSTIKPFIFETKAKEMKSQIAGLKQKESSMLNVKENIDKENKDCTKPKSAVKKRQGTQNAKCDINKLAESNKITGKRMANPLRGVPLSENIPRN